MGPAGPIALGLAIAVVLGGVWIGPRGCASEKAARQAFAQESGSLPVAGISAPVEVLRDARGIPHIEALRERDAWVALGFVHAQDRIAQMLWLRRLARGTTAEVVGEAGFVPDRMARTLGLGRLADEQIGLLEPDVLGVLEAYAEGVNARLARIRSGAARAPLPLAGRGETFEDWRPADSLALIKLVAWSSSNLLETGLVLDDLIRWLGGQPSQPFMPSSTTVRGVDIPSSRPPNLLDAPPPLPEGELLAPSRALTESVAIRGGHAWVLGGKHTQSGAPILVADLRLPPTVPSLIHEVHARGGDLDVAGASIPGIPLVWAGRNLHVAWAATPTDAVTVDLFKEVVRESDDHYQNGSLWVPVEERREVIRVRGSGGTLRDEEIVIRSTRHGPLIGDLLRPWGGEDAEQPAREGLTIEPLERSPLAVQWTGMKGGEGFSSMLGVMRASDAEQLLVSLASHHEPVVAVTYADDGGSAGMQLAGWLPERRLPTEVVPIEGRMRRYDWRRQIDYSALPAQHLTEGRSLSWVIVADGDLGDGLTGAEIEWLWRTGAQTRRLQTRLKELTGRKREKGEKVDLRDAAVIQYEQAAGSTDTVIPALLRLSQHGGELRPEAREVAQMLGRWRGDTGTASQGAAVYHVLMEHLVDELFRERFGSQLYERYVSLPQVRPALVAESLVVAADRSGRRGGWADVRRVSEAVRISLRRTWVSLSYRLGPNRADWSWGNLHRLRFRPFANLGPEAGRHQPTLPPLAIGGDETLLGGASYDKRNGAYLVTSAPSYLVAVDLAAPDRMLSALAPGQSEHPYHPRYSDGLARWLEGRPSLLLTSRLLVEEKKDAQLLLEPSS
jgi:penicillin amidase